MRAMSKINGMHVKHNGQDNGAEDETKIHIHISGMWSGMWRCDERWNEMRWVYSVTVGEVDGGTEENKGEAGRVFVVTNRFELTGGVPLGSQRRSREY